MEQIALKLTGTSPLLMHNVRLVDDLDPMTRRLAEAVSEAKARKTETARMALRRVEFEAGLYWDETLGPYVPSRWIMKSLRDAAALTKKGKGIERGVVPLDDEIRLDYRGPRDVEGMWEARYFDVRAIGIGTSKTMRTRPSFREWSCTTTVMFEPSLVDRKTLLAQAEQAGAFMGIGDGRRLRFGRFRVEAA